MVKASIENHLTPEIFAVRNALNESIRRASFGSVPGKVIYTELALLQRSTILFPCSEFVELRILPCRTCKWLRAELAGPAHNDYAWRGLKALL
jgi:hypothetical protein